MNSTSTLWNYALASRYETPAHPATEKVKTGLSALWKRFWPINSQGSADEEDSECRPLSEMALAEIMPESHWDAAANALTVQLNPWVREKTPDSFMQAVIGPPGSGVSEVVTRWGNQASARLLLPPDPARLFDPGSDYWQGAELGTEGILVIPELERFYLRHSDGFDLIRQLVELLWTSPRKIVVGCDSWTWAYLCNTVKIDAAFRMPMALESLSGDALRAWFRPRPRGRYFVRTAGNGELIYPIESAEDAARNVKDGTPENQEQQYKGADVFQRIAAMSRGIPEVALALWRECLCEGEAEANRHESRSALELTPMPIHVRAPQELALPSIPAGASTREAIILHTLLLHAGLPSSILFQIVPFPVSDVIATLSALREARLILERAGVWKVAPLGYSSVRSFVRAETLLIDLF